MTALLALFTPHVIWCHAKPNYCHCSRLLDAMQKNDIF